jgi:hypothetical protein
MKRTILTCILILLFGCSINTQKNTSWEAFRDDKSDLIGFRDQNDKVRIEAVYNDFTIARKFDKIVAVMEENTGNNKTYYLTKSGKKFGISSIYFFDNGPDCESEGFIRFRDNKTDKVGMFNSEGEIVIPAEYDDLTNVRNGLVVALKGAKKIYSHGNKPSDCNHFSWVGGKEYLIDTANHIIIDNFKYESSLDFFSLKIEQKPVKDASRQSFLGVDSRYYSFVDYKKEFQEWLNSALLDALSPETLIRNSYHEIYFWKEPEGWVSETGSTFINRNYGLIQGRLTGIKNNHSDYFISIDGLNPFIYVAAEFDVYYNNCREPKEWQYPVMSVVIHHKTKNDFYQDQFEFLRTANGYKLISVTIRNEELK